MNALKTENYLMICFFLQDFNISHINQHRACQKCCQWGDDINAQDNITRFDGSPLIPGTSDLKHTQTFKQKKDYTSPPPPEPLPM